MNPSYWVFKRRSKWHSAWRDQHGRCHSRVQPLGAGKDLALEYARGQALEATRVRAGLPLPAKDLRSALDAFLARADVKNGTHALNARHLEAFLAFSKIRHVEDLTVDRMHRWLAHIKKLGWNPGGQGISLRILRTFSRFCFKQRWLSSYPFLDFKIPKSQFVGRYLSDEERVKLLSIDPRYEVDRHLNRALTFGLYSLLRISQVFAVDWSNFRMPDQLWIPGIKGQEGRWITVHPKALAVMGEPKEFGQVFNYWPTLASFRESVLKKVRREKLHGVRFHEMKHTGISALLEAGYSVPEVCRISGNSYRTIAHYAHVNEKKVFEKWKGFEYGGASAPQAEICTATVQQNLEKVELKRAPKASQGQQGENAKQRQFATSSSIPTDEN